MTRRRGVSWAPHFVTPPLLFTFPRVPGFETALAHGARGGIGKFGITVIKRVERAFAAVLQFAFPLFFQTQTPGPGPERT